MRKLVYRSTGPLLGAAIVFRLIFCPADLCAHTMAELPAAEQASHTAASDDSRQAPDFQSNGSRKDSEHSMPCHGEGSSDSSNPAKSSDSNTGASCCNDETVTDSPTAPALSITEAFLERLAAVLRQPVELSVLDKTSPDFRSGPPDGLRLHLKNQTFLN